MTSESTRPQNEFSKREGSHIIRTNSPKARRLSSPYQSHSVDPLRRIQRRELEPIKKASNLLRQKSVPTNRFSQSAHAIFRRQVETLLVGKNVAQEKANESKAIISIGDTINTKDPAPRAIQSRTRSHGDLGTDIRYDTLPSSSLSATSRDTHSLELNCSRLSSVPPESKLTPTTLASNEIPFSSIISKCLNGSTPTSSLRQRPLRSLSFMASSYHERYENISSLSELPRSGLSLPSLFRERDPNNPFQVDPASPFLGSSWKSGTDSASGKLSKAASASPFLARLQNLTPSPDITSRKTTNYTGFNDGLDEKLESTAPTSLECGISQQQSPPSLLRSIASRKSSFLINRVPTSESIVVRPTFNKSPSPPKAAENLLLGWRRHQSMITRRGEFMNTLTPSPIQQQAVPDNKSPLRLASSRYSPDQRVEECQILPYTLKSEDITKRVSPETVVDVLEGKYLSKYDVLYIIDCRFPYEYKGGHIRNAINVNTKDTLDKLLLRPAITDMRVLVIFHCEFSCERGPRMAGYLRNQDRIANADNYPALFYPEIYVMEGGYSGFFKTNKLYCEPQAYVEMQDASHSVEFKEHMRTFGREFSRSASKNFPKMDPPQIQEQTLPSGRRSVLASIDSSEPNGLLDGSEVKYTSPNPHPLSLPSPLEKAQLQARRPTLLSTLTSVHNRRRFNASAQLVSSSFLRPRSNLGLRVQLSPLRFRTTPRTLSSPLPAPIKTGGPSNIVVISDEAACRNSNP